MLERILVATDGSHHARKAVGYASEMALTYKAQVFIVHVIPPLPHISDETVLQMIADRQQEAGREILGAAEGRLKEDGVQKFKSAVLSGDPAYEILRFARKNQVDMIVVGSRGAGAVERLLLGSVSHKVCHLADCTCMAVK